MLSFILMLVAFTAGGYLLGQMAAVNHGRLWEGLSTFHRICLCGYALLLILVLINGLFVVDIIFIVCGAGSYLLGYKLTAPGPDDVRDEDDHQIGGDADGIQGQRLPASVSMRHHDDITVLDADGRADDSDGEAAHEQP